MGCYGEKKLSCLFSLFIHLFPEAQWSHVRPDFLDVGQTLRLWAGFSDFTQVEAHDRRTRSSTVPRDSRQPCKSYYLLALP